jgi:hypothetical protein
MLWRRRPGSFRTRGVAVLGLVLLAGCDSDPVPIPATTPAAADRARCEDLLDVLPDEVSDQSRESISPVDALGAAWGDPAIVLACGGSWALPATATCSEANGVGWWIPEDEIDDRSHPDELGDVTMTTIGWTPAVQVRIPADYRPPAATMIDLSAAIKETLERTGDCS